MSQSINQLSESAPTSASQIPSYDPVSGSDRRFSVSALATVLQTILAAEGAMLTQYSAPNATGFSVSASPFVDGGSIYLLITPAGSYANGTIVLPAASTCSDGQELLVACTQPVATLTVDGNGAVVNGPPASLDANGFFRLRFDGVFHAWYRVG